MTTNNLVIQPIKNQQLHCDWDLVFQLFVTDNLSLSIV